MRVDGGGGRIVEGLPLSEPGAEESSSSQRTPDDRGKIKSRNPGTELDKRSC